MTFHVGQKVVCVNAEIGAFDVPGLPNPGTPLGIEKGGIYTIREITTCPFDGRLAFRLCEVIREYDAWLDAERFRPAVKIGMSILRAIAADPKPLVEQEPEYEGVPFLD